MSFHKSFSVVCLAGALFSGCGAESPSADVNQVQQLARGDGWGSTNSNQLFGGTLSGVTITGLYFSEGAWYLSTASSLTYAMVSGIQYNGAEVAAADFSTSLGYFQLLGEQPELLKESSFNLELAVAAPLEGTLRFTGAQLGSSFARYATAWIAAGSDPDVTPPSLCPHEQTDADGNTIVTNEGVIPIGGTRWLLNGSRTADANAISLGCAQDAIGGCVNWGYGPWGTKLEEGTGLPLAMASVHQACTRMKRADVCGSGSPITTGTVADYGETVIHVRDRVGVHATTNQTYTTMEAFWDENGASCINASEFRNDSPTIAQRMQINLALCPARNVACTATHTTVLMSARPCTVTSATGACIAN